MSQNNYIAELLDMKDIQIIELKTGTDKITIEFQLQQREHICPVCKAVTDKVHDYRKQVVKDLPVQGNHVYWYYRKRRYRCDCCNKRFPENLYLLPRYHRIASRVAAYAFQELSKKQSNQDIAQRLGVSSSTIGRWLKLLSYQPSRQLPAVIAIDEFRENAGREKFQGILTAPIHKSIIDILPSRKSHELTDSFRRFENRKAVEYVVMGMCIPYLEIAKSQAAFGSYENAKSGEQTSC